MVRLEHLDCPKCGIVEHTVTDKRRICLGCGTINEGEKPGDCRFAECPNNATHLVVYNPIGGERISEYYCESHAESAADEAERDVAGDLFLGPQLIH